MLLQPTLDGFVATPSIHMLHNITNIRCEKKQTYNKSRTVKYTLSSERNDCSLLSFKVSTIASWMYC
jgi:hypothetical protein